MPTYRYRRANDSEQVEVVAASYELAPSGVAVFHDVTEENGSVYLLPYSRSGIKSYIKHIRDPELNDMVCYFGTDPGIPMTAPAGSIVVFSSVVIHRSGPNQTDRHRRVYLAQYSKEIIPSKDGQGAHGSFDPFLKAGQNIADR